MLTRGSMNLSVRDGGLPPDSVVQDEDAILADSERLVAAHHEPGDGAMVQIALAPCSPFSVTRSLMRRTAELAERLDVRLHTHLAETEDENRFCVEKFGGRPLDYLEECGWLGPRTWLAHGVHFNPAEIDRMARAGTAVTHCPCSNQTLASGHCPVHGMEQAGMTVGLGVDGSASNDGSNLMQEVRAAFLLQRLHLRRDRDQPPRRAALGDRRLRRLPRPAGSRHDRAGQAGRPGPVHAGRAALRRRMATRWRRWCCAARTGPISSWSAGPGG